MSRDECEHGSLTRKCETCALLRDLIDLRADLAEAKREVARLERENEELRKQTPMGMAERHLGDY